MFGLGPMELVVIAVVALLVGGKRLPDMGRGMGEAIRLFRESLTAKPPSEEEKKQIK